MSIGSILAGHVPLLRQQAESMMTDSCEITRPSGSPTFNPVTGEYDSAGTTTVYSGKCRVRPRSSFMRERLAEAGEAQKTLWPYIVSVPVSVTGIEPYDLVTITTSGDPSLIGRQLRIRIAARGSDITARRLDCEETANA